MKRDLYEKLIEWEKDNNRRPMILKGARQVGKTFLKKNLKNRSIVYKF